MAKRKKSVQINVSIPEENYPELKRRADSMDLSEAAYLRRVYLEYVRDGGYMVVSDAPLPVGAMRTTGPSLQYKSQRERKKGKGK